MSGHSHYSNIKRKKEAKDKKRARKFSKLSRAIIRAVREGGDDPKTNVKLKNAIDKAREADMPKDNIEKAIKKGKGNLDGGNLQKIDLEIKGFDRLFIIVETETDNKNRTLTKIKKTLKDYDAQLTSEGSVKWSFNRKGEIILDVTDRDDSKDEIELVIIDAGAEDIEWEDEDSIKITTTPNELGDVRKALEEKGFEIDDSSLIWVSQNKVELNDEEQEKYEELVEALKDNMAVQEVYSNIK